MNTIILIQLENRSLKKPERLCTLSILILSRKNPKSATTSSWGDEDSPSKEPEPPLLVVADF